MINRSKIKYALKKILPSFIFILVEHVWHYCALPLVNFFDNVRLMHFTKKTLVTLEHSHKKFSLYISPQNGFIDNYIYLYGIYEPFMLDIMAQHLRPGMTFIDIGANIGQHSIYAATLVGNTGSVFAFEPIPYIYNQMNASVASNHFESIIHTRNYALGEQNTIETLYISSNVGGSSIAHEDRTKEEIKVTVKNGDEELLSLSSVDMIKIDVEGYEYEVLSGIEKTLKSHHPIILLEFSGNFYHTQNKHHGEKILSLLEKINYTFYDIEDSMKKVTNITEFVSLFNSKRVQTNLLCIVK